MSNLSQYQELRQTGLECAIESFNRSDLRSPSTDEIIERAYAFTMFIFDRTMKPKNGITLQKDGV